MRADVDAAPPLSSTEKLAEFLVLALLGVGFFIAPMKMLGGGWFAYLLPDFLATAILLIVLGSVTAAYGAVQWNAGPESFQQWSPAYAEYAVRMNWSVEEGVRFRAFSTFVAPGAFAGNMALLMSLAFTVVASSRLSPVHRIFALGAFGVMGTGIAVSGSRAPLVHLVLMAALLPLMFPRFWSG